MIPSREVNDSLKWHFVLAQAKSRKSKEGKSKRRSRRRKRKMLQKIASICREIFRIK